MDANVHMHSPRAACLRPPAQAKLLEQRLRFGSHATYIIPLNSRSWIQIDPELVGMVQIARGDGMRVQLDAAEIDDPGQAGGVIDDEFVGGAAGGERERDGA